MAVFFGMVNMWYYYTLKQDPYWRGRPPQMLPWDVPVWHRYLDKHQDEYKEVIYNFAITEKEPPKGLPENIIKSWMYSSAVRIDAIGARKDGSYDIIEVTRQANLRAVGQILVYTDLIIRADPFKTKYNSMIVAEYANPDIKPVLEKNNIKLILCPPE